MTKMNCDVIKDMLPLYVEDLASDSTRKIVEEHLDICEECRKEKVSLCTEMTMPRNNDTKIIKNIENTLFRKRIATILASVLTMALIFVLILLNLHAPIVLPYEDVEESICVTENENGELAFDIKDPTLAVKIEYGTSEDGLYTADVSCYTTKWKQKFEKGSGGNIVALENGQQPIRQIHYYPTTTGGNVCLYDVAEKSGNTSSGYVTLPRLVLNYYMFFSLLLSVIGVVLCLCLHKKKKAVSIATNVTIVPVMYFISSIVILAGKGDIYNSVYYFSGILLSTILMSMIGWSIVALIRYRKR